MNSDDWFEDLDDAALEQIDAIEAAALSQIPVSESSNSNTRALAADSSFDMSFDIDESELRKLDSHVDALYEDSRPVFKRVNSTNNTRQTTLEGGFIPSPPKVPNSRSQTRVKSSNNVSGRMTQKSKKWDHTQFAKTGIRPATTKSKGRKKAADPNGWDEEEDDQFDQFPAPFIPSKRCSYRDCVSLTLQCSRVSIPFLPFAKAKSAENLHRPPPPMKLIPDLLEAKHWIYPLNKPKRDYQFNIVRHCLFDNTLVALPTGLGKTFIAGAVMLNYYRWFPEGKVVFVAPTKPLVSQQIHACHKVCGIPGTDAVQLTGTVQKHFRAQYWKDKRVFYMTPQTLRNDLMGGSCDAMDIILLVIDEAHRATGGYAYNEVIRFLMAKNPHFRVLALTATPGGTPEATQNLIDGLHISHVEIRDENSIDIVQYLHEKRIEQHIIRTNDDIDRVKDLLVKVMEPIIQPLRQRGILFGIVDPVKMHPYMPLAKCQNLQLHQKWAFLPLSKLSTLARAMGYLLEGTLNMCYSYLRDLIGEEGASGMPCQDENNSAKIKKTAAPKQPKSKVKWRNDQNFMTMMADLEQQRSRGFQMHPKMVVLKELLVNFFGKRQGENESEEGGRSKAIIFVSFREIVGEIVQMLDEYRPLIRASKFIGQGQDKQGDKGITQKHQLEIIQQFQAEEFNVLVATSVGEEGLDIGEVDFIVCYDAQKTPVRMLQRLGRTGRQRDGIVHVLLAEHREELNMEKAKTSYKAVQKTIWRGNQLELYGDVERLIPEHIKPECLEKMMDITPYEPEEPYKKNGERTDTKTKTKRKRNDDIGRNIPLAASMGFVRASELTIKGAKKRKKNGSQAIKTEKGFDEQGIDDDTDEELESGLIVPKPRRTKSSSASTSKPKALRQTKLRKATTLDSGTKKKATKKIKVEDPASSQFSELGRDDSDDMDIEETTLSSSPKTKRWTGGCAEAKASPTMKLSQEISKHKSSTSPSSTGAIIDISDTDSENEEVTQQPSSSCKASVGDLGWMVEHDDEMCIRIASSSPIVGRSKAGPSRLLRMEAEEQSIQIIGAPSSPLQDVKGKAKWVDMPPPDLLPGFNFCPSPDSPALTHPVKRASKVRALALAGDGYSSPKEEPLRRLRRHPPSSTPIRSKGKAKMTMFEAQQNPLFDVIAHHSGDEVSEGASNSEDEVESESDRLFIKNSPLTQVADSYDQSLIYRQSLLTQAPSGVEMPLFANAPVRSNLFGPKRAARCVDLSSSPVRGSDDYEFGSFVVPDDAEVL